MRNYLTARSAARGRSIHSFPKRYRSFIEPLESRHLLSATVIEVNTTADIVDSNDAFISLREAVLMANASSEDNEIRLPSGTYALTRQGANEDAGLTGDLDVVNNGKLEIVGAGSFSTIITAEALFSVDTGFGDRIFDLHANVDGALSDVRLLNGNVDTDGGAIRVAGGTLSVTRSRIDDSIAAGNGGGIFLGVHGSLSLQATLTANSAAMGGAIYNQGQLAIRGHLSSNTALKGGAIYHESEHVLTIDGATLIYNSAEQYGGAIVASGPVAVSDSTLSNNDAQAGGAVYGLDSQIHVVGGVLNGNGAVEGGAIKSLRGSVIVDGTLLAGNSAHYGGAIYADSGLALANAILTGNIATADGGAILATDDLRATHTTFFANRSDQYGGAVAWLPDRGVSSTQQLDIEHVQVLENQADQGGGIYIQYETSQVMRNPRIRYSVFSGNQATERGGGISFVSYSVLELENNDFTMNTALRGGGVYLFGGVLLTGGSLTENQADVGAGMYVSSFARSRIVGAQFLDNRARLGGGIFAGPSTFFQLTHSILAGNTVSENGGAIFVNGTTLEIGNSTIYQNYAAKRGGGIYGGENASFTVRDSTLSQNSAGEDGGGIYALKGRRPSLGRSEISNSTLLLNRADADGNGSGSGGGIAMEGTTSLTNSVLAGNVAGVDGSDAPSDLTLVGGTVDPASNYNLIADPSTAGGLTHGVNGNIVGDSIGGVLDVNTVLDTTLADNGGPTLTHALLADSPAVNAGDPSFDSGTVPFDQRGAGFARVTGGRVDIGAFEYGSEFENIVAGRHIFYNNSWYDGNDDSINLLDSAAIDISKQALLPDGTRADSSNVTSYSRGINGIMIDLAGSHSDITADDFIFRVGATNDPASWAAAPAPSAIQVLSGQGVGGADRVVITWPDGAIKNTYLQVIVLANADTGLGEEDVFFFGNRVGDSFSTQPPASFVTSAADELAARNTPPNFNFDITNRFDFDRNGTINAADILTARTNPGFLPRIQIAPPAAASPLIAATTAIEAIAGKSTLNRVSQADGNAVASGPRRVKAHADATAATNEHSPQTSENSLQRRLTDQAVAMLWDKPNDSLASSTSDDAPGESLALLNDCILELIHLS